MLAHYRPRVIHSARFLHDRYWRRKFGTRFLVYRVYILVCIAIKVYHIFDFVGVCFFHHLFSEPAEDGPHAPACQTREVATPDEDDELRVGVA